MLGGPGPRRQFREPAVGPVIDELGQHVGQIGFGIDAVQLTGLNQRGEHRPVFRPFVAAGEQSILSVQSNRSHAALDGIGVDVLESISMRPSSRKRTSPSQWLRPYRMAWAIDEPLATCTRIFSSQVFSVATRGLVFSCRTTRRSLALLPRILASIS